MRRAIAVFSSFAAGLVPFGSVSHANELGLAVVVANSAYSVAVGALGHTIHDAKRLERDLQDRLGYKVLYFENATNEKLREQVARLKSESSKATHVVVYFGGYAANSDGENYLLGTDSQPSSARQTGVSLSEITRAIDPSVKTATVLLDASYQAGEFRADGPVKPGLTRISQPRDGVVIISAQQPDRLAVKPDAGSGSPLSRAVTAAIIDERPQKGTIGRWFDFIRDLIVDETQSEQEPYLVASQQSRRVQVAALAPDRRASTTPVTTTDVLPGLGTPEISPVQPEPSESELAKSLQQRLKKLACYDGKDDGNWGPKSKTALETFVKYARQDGSLGKKLREAGLTLNDIERSVDNPRELHAFFEKFKFEFFCPLKEDTPTAGKSSNDEAEPKKPAPKPKVAQRDEDDDKPSRRSSSSGSESKSSGSGSGSSGSGGSSSAPAYKSSGSSGGGNKPNLNFGF